MNAAPLRFSVLKQMAKSPAHAKWAMENPSPDTAAMRFGRLVHSVFLGSNVPTVFKGERRGNVWRDFKLAHDGQDIVTDSELEEAAEMAAALHTHKEARTLLLGQRERTVLFNFAGRACRGTPDIFTPDRIVDLKTTADASPRRFPWTALNFAYHGQLAWYADGLRAAGAADPERLFIVAIESKPPYAVAVYQLTDAAIEFGRRLYRSWLEQFLVCEASNDWPGYVDGVLDAPEESVELVGTDGEVIEMD